MSDGFDELSPEVGELDEAALAAAVADDPDVALDLVAKMATATDESLRRRVLEIAAELFLELAMRERADTVGIGRLVTQRYRFDEAELDLDASLSGVIAARAERRLLEPDELRVRQWAVPSTAWCLLVDRSGSMHGAPLATAAMAAAAISVRADDSAVVAFARDPIAVRAMWEHRRDTIERLLALRGSGTTDVAAALRAAHDQFNASTARRRVTVLLSDCRSSEQGDVVAAARELDELFILAPSEDPGAARELASACGAGLALVDGPSDIVDALRGLDTAV